MKFVSRMLQILYCLHNVQHVLFFHVGILLSLYATIYKNYKPSLPENFFLVDRGISSEQGYPKKNSHCLLFFFSPLVMVRIQTLLASSIHSSNPREDG